MKKIREWAPWTKVIVGIAGISIGVASVVYRAREYEVTGEMSGGAIVLGSFFQVAGLVFLIWGTIEALKKRPRLFGAVVLGVGVILLSLTIIGLPTLWEWAKGGVWNGIPAPFLVPLVPVIPVLIIFYGIAGVRGK